jgi:hypothetical protein
MCPQMGYEQRPLQVKLDAKTTEAERLRCEVQKAKLETQMLRLQLQVRGVADGSLIPADMGTGGKPRAADLKCSEHKRLVEWLAQNVDLSCKQAYNVPEPEVNVGGHRALLGRMIQWRLNVPGGLRLSVPFDSEMELVDVLLKTRAERLELDKLEAFADDWLLVTTDLVTDNVATPALFLIHNQSQKAIVVSAWPSISVALPPAPPVAIFDPAAFFSRPAPTPCVTLPDTMGTGLCVFLGTDGLVSRLHSSECMLWSQGLETRQVTELGVSFSITDQFTLTGPFGSCVISDPAPGPFQRFLVSGLVTLALEHGVRVQRSSTPTRTELSREEAQSDGEFPTPGRPRSMSSGDQVEVQYKGSWLRGILQDVKGELAHVKCDVDENGVITVAPLDRVRPADFNIECSEADGEHFAEGFSRC